MQYFSFFERLCTKMNRKKKKKLKFYIESPLTLLFRSRIRKREIDKKITIDLCRTEYYEIS